VELSDSRVVRGDPATGTTVVRYEPPEGFSPAASGFIEARRYRPSLFSAALVDLGVQGAVKIEKQDRHWQVERAGAAAALVAGGRVPLAVERRSMEPDPID